MEGHPLPPHVTTKSASRPFQMAHNWEPYSMVLPDREGYPWSEPLFLRRGEVLSLSSPKEQWKKSEEPSLWGLRYPRSFSAPWFYKCVISTNSTIEFSPNGKCSHAAEWLLNQDVKQPKAVVPLQNLFYRLKKLIPTWFSVVCVPRDQDLRK